MSKDKGKSCAQTAMLMLFLACAFAFSLLAEEVIITEGGYRWWFNVNDKEAMLTRFCFYNSTPSTVSPDVTIPAVVNGIPVTKIGSAFGGDAWYDNDKGKYVSGEFVRTVKVPETVTEIGEKSFSGCEDLVSVSIPPIVSSIGNYAFNGCNKLTEIRLPSALKVIGKSAFEKSGLKSVALPNGLSAIYEYAFAGTALQTITIPSTVLLIGGYAFSGTRITTLTFDGCRPEIFIWPLDNRYDNYEDPSSPWSTNKPLPFGSIKAYPWNVASFSGYKYEYSYHENVKVKWFPDHSGYEVLEDKTVYCEFKPTLEYRTDVKTWTICFDPNGGSDVPDVQVKQGDAITGLPVTIRDGYIFEGWFTEPNGGNLITPDYIVTGDIVLYAHWERRLTAQQRYPWNGLVDIVVILDVAETECLFVATNNTTKEGILVENITQNGVDVGSGKHWIRKFIWNAAADVGALKIDEIELTVDTKDVGGVQLWENGPYWAECNVGAAKPEESGYYFWWGDTVGYKRNASNNGWISVKDSNPFSFVDCPTNYKKNSQLQSEGFIDSAGNLVVAYDAATAYRGATWRMPTDAEFSALIDNCTTTWTTRNGVKGRLVTGKDAYASKSIFLPAAGYGLDSDVDGVGWHGSCWSSTPHSSYLNDAWELDFGSGFFERNNSFRYYGHPVRPVRVFATNGTVPNQGHTTHLSVDCRVNAKVADSAHPLVYDVAWYTGGVTAKITANGQEIVSGTAGTYAWEPPSDGVYLLTLNVYNVLGDVVGTESVWVDGVTGGGEGINYTDAVVGKDVTGLDEPVTVPATWVTDFLVQHYGMGKVDAFRQLFGGDLAGALAKPTGKLGPGGEVRTVWDDYVAGTDPTDPASVFTTTIAIADGKVVLDWSPNLNLGSVNRLYRVKSKLKLSDTWTCPPVTGHHFFMTEVAMPDGKTQTASPGVIGNASPDVNGGADKLAHRWSFNGNLADAVSGKTGSAIGGVSADGTSYTLPGGTHGTGYLDLGHVFPTNEPAMTLEIWATQISAKYYSHIFHVGRVSPMCMEWSLATFINYDELGCPGINTDNNGFCTHLAPYTLGTEFHISVVVAPQADGTSKVAYCKRDATTGEILKKCEYTSPTGWSLAMLDDDELCLGHDIGESNVYDANARYNEVRIWNRALSEDEIKKSVEAGPDLLPLK